MKLEEGKYYVDKYDGVHGPMVGLAVSSTQLWRADRLGEYRFNHRLYWTTSGECCTAFKDKLDLVAELVMGDGAAKFDAGKAPAFQGLTNRFPRALMAIAEISGYGKAKYGTFDGWERVPDAYARYRDAMLRHVLSGSISERDAESGHLHAAHAAWNAIATLELLLRENEAK